MGWDDFVTRLLEGPCDRAAIVGLDGNVWAKSQGCAPRAQEMKDMIAGFDQPHALMSGGCLGGTLPASTTSLFARTEREHFLERWALAVSWR